MLQIARLSPRQLGESAGLVTGFLESQLNADGGFRDRSDRSDLYYTVFGLESLVAMGAALPVSTEGYLRSFGDGDGLDLVHLCCLVRCWATLRRGVPPVDAGRVMARLEEHRTPDGGYHTVPGGSSGTTYGCMLVFGAYEDLQQPAPDTAGLLRCMESLRAGDGGYANMVELPMGLTPPTAAAATLLRHLDQPVPEGLAEWLLGRCHPDGGFYATPSAPIPDLLSTATALHALACLKAPIEPVREACLDFVDTLWTNRGAFYGNWMDDTADCEYTYYGLLALGHLSL